MSRWDDPVTGDEPVTRRDLDDAMEEVLEHVAAGLATEPPADPRAALVEEYLGRMGITASAHQISVVNLKERLIWIDRSSSLGSYKTKHPIFSSLMGEFAGALIAYFKSRGLDGVAERIDAQLRDRDLGATAARFAAAAPPTNRTNQETATVSEKPATPTLAESAKTFGIEVAYRTAALQLTKRMRGLLADALTHHLKGKARASKRKMILDILDGPAGGPLVALLLSGLLPQAAGLIGQDGARVGRLAEELRLHAGVTVASELVDGLFGLLGPAKEALSQAFSGLPDVQVLQAPTGRCAVIDMETERARAEVVR